jgi:hypothetical protein
MTVNYISEKIYRKTSTKRLFVWQPAHFNAARSKRLMYKLVMTEVAKKSTQRFPFSVTRVSPVGYRPGGRKTLEANYNDLENRSSLKHSEN